MGSVAFDFAGHMDPDKAEGNTGFVVVDVGVLTWLGLSLKNKCNRLFQVV